MEVSVFSPPPQLTEHVEFADQSDQAGHGEVLQSATLVRYVKPLLPVQIQQTLKVSLIL